MGAGVLQRVRERLLQNAVHGELDARRQGGQILGYVGRDVDPSGGDLLEQLIQTGQVGLWLETDIGVIAPHYPDGASHFIQGLAAAGLDRIEGCEGLLRILGQDSLGPRRLERHHRDVVGDHVMELSGDASPFDANRACRLALLVPLGALGPFPQQLSVLQASPRCVAHDPRGRVDEGDNQNEPKWHLGQQRSEGDPGHHGRQDAAADTVRSPGWHIECQAVERYEQCELGGVRRLEAQTGDRYVKGVRRDRRRDRVETPRRHRQRGQDTQSQQPEAVRQLLVRHRLHVEVAQREVLKNDECRQEEREAGVGQKLVAVGAHPQAWHFDSGQWPDGIQKSVDPATGCCVGRTDDSAVVRADEPPPRVEPGVGLLVRWPAMRLVIARCSVDYDGRLTAHLPLATRLIMVKADGCVAVHADGGAYKPLNWMNAPNHLVEEPGLWTVTNPKGEQLLITIDEILSDTEHELGMDPGLEKDGVEAHLQALLADRPDLLEEGLSLIRREYATDIGPVDLLCRSGAGETVAVEIKRRGEIDGVEQLTRYLDRLSNDSRLHPLRGIFAAQLIAPQAKVLAEARGIRWVEIDYDELRGVDSMALKLF